MDRDSWNVRIAATEDAGDIARLLHDFNTEFETPSPGVDLAGEPAIAVALVTLRSNVWYDGQVAVLDELYVVPDLRDRGIGSAVMRQLHSRARTTGVAAIEINVDEGDTDTQRFYQRHGYSWIEPTTNERAFYFFQELTT